ncbi:chloramphenicol phosphotransferase CPT family protein [Leucobacter komagatae]|uniref:Chloramphenicol phosphotransferase n=1 Tax=Leucobacter komagatae TaxID=55969 RepID=A0A0D0H794_9MICO|nr:chloramphenicol phosphotransferase CPT family protein [Leucobacter komagatae]KIP53010.1 chloramphenicol phosphotransferase [Leucobacter komagatae]
MATSSDVNAMVIVLNGGSSAGKSSIARALQELLPDTWLAFGVDSFIEALPGRGDSSRSGIAVAGDGEITLTSEFRSLERAWYAGLRAMVDAGAPLILDEVFLDGKPAQERLRSQLGAASILWVGVHCAPDIAMAREARRGDRVAGMAQQQALKVHSGVTYDVEVDTGANTAEECAREILRHSAVGAARAS